jgi:hypothetical protein
VDLHHYDADPDSTYHPGADSDLDADPDSVPYILACHLQINADPDPAYHFDADPDLDWDLDWYPDFYLMRMWIQMRIQVTKMIRIRIINIAVGL